MTLQIILNIMMGEVLLENLLI